MSLHTDRPGELLQIISFLWSISSWVIGVTPPSGRMCGNAGVTGV